MDPMGNLVPVMVQNGVPYREPYGRLQKTEPRGFPLQMAPVGPDLCLLRFSHPNIKFAGRLREH
jgi:hypothetical protein